MYISIQNQMVKSIIRPAFFLLGLTVVFAASCAGKQITKHDKTSSDSKGGKSEAPADSDPAVAPESVTGAYLTIECVITNKNDPAAKDTNAACKILDNRAAKFKGQVDTAQVKLERVSSTTGVAGQQTLEPANSEYSFRAIFAGVSPNDALGVELKAKFDGLFAVLYDVLDEYSTKNTVEKDYYVSSKASPENSQCAQAQPCKTIERAMRLLPDTIGPLITIHVEEGNYSESLIVSGQKFDPTKIAQGLTALKIIGEKSPNSTTVGRPLFRLQGPPKESLIGVFPLPPMLYVAAMSEAGLSIENVEVEACYSRGISVWKAAVELKNVQIVGCHYPFIGDNQTPFAKFSGLTVSESKVRFTGEWFAITNFDTNLMGVRTGIALIGGSVLETWSDIVIDAKFTHGILVVDHSRMILHPTTALQSPGRILKIGISEVTKVAIGVYNFSQLIDSSLEKNPSQGNRTRFEIGSTGTGMWAYDNAIVGLNTSDVDIGKCADVCLRSDINSTLTIGQNAVLTDKLPDRNIYEVAVKVSLNASTAASTQTSPLKILRAEDSSSISLRSTIEDLTICSGVTPRNFLAGEKSSVRIAAKSSVLRNIDKNCSSPLLGAIEFGLENDPSLSVGFINASPTPLKLENCDSKEPILDCRNRAVPQ